MTLLIISFATSLIVTLLLVRYASGHDAWAANTFAPQTVHSRSIPRIGGVSLFFAVLIAEGWAQHSAIPDDHGLRWSFLVASLPAFLSGLVEDVTRRVPPRRRLVLNATSAVLGVWLLDAVLKRSDIPGLELLIQWYPTAILLTVFAVTGVANSVNIIDGFNGLASMCVLLMLLSLGYVAYRVGDAFVLTTALALCGAVLGFFVLNFPAGLIFLGDGGAYFLGFMVAELGVLLIGRNAEVSPLCPLLICIYPIFETVFSMYRRRVVRGIAAAAPDGIHLHTLLYRRVVRPALLGTGRGSTMSNSMTSPYLWVLCLLSVAPAVLFWDSTLIIACFLALFAVTYVVLYNRISRFKTPKWLTFDR
ncbi:MraY family glycosyltransferase [Ideonella sp. BN130291]|uniref:MraY family glycosyltransferase n=1 Tax=Ideonella sp. BN130291 TaxID=3112940 RepID=UPI002E26C890|nr:glycosyltransferase [Ideonella sp. BN130291]